MSYLNLDPDGSVTASDYDSWQETHDRLGNFLPRAVIRDTDDYALIAVALDDAADKCRYEVNRAAALLRGEFGPIPEDTVESTRDGLAYWADRCCRLYELRNSLTV